MEAVSYDTFASLDIRIGEIREVAVVEDADKLLKLTVDVGEVNADGAPVLRQIVSGIRAYFADPQVLVGVRCPFIVNLAPRTIRGLESQGMILAAGEGESFALLTPSSLLPVGTKVR